MEARTQDIERRLTTLEVQLRRTRLAAGALALALGSVAAIGFVRQPQVQDTVRAHRFLAVDDSGRIRVMLIDNETKAVAKLQSDGRGGGGVQVFGWDVPRKIVRIRTLTYGGDVRDSVAIGH